MHNDIVWIIKKKKREKGNDKKSTHFSSGQIFGASSLRLDQMIAVDRRGHSHTRQAAADELQHGHLSRGVLHSYTVGTQTQVSATAVDVLVVGVIEVAVHNLL